MHFNTGLGQSTDNHSIDEKSTDLIHQNFYFIIFINNVICNIHNIH